MLIETNRAGAPFPHCGAAHGASGGPRAGPEPGAALLARCAAQSCEKQGGLLSLSMAQRGCWCSRAAVQWREGLIGGDLVLLQRAQHAPSPGAETCWWATGASFSVLSLALCSICRNTPVALTGARGASCREWSERLEARGCRSTLRRMRAAKAARQATGIVATRSPLLQLCFADQKRPSFAF